jgi:hypothetical protein
MADWVGQYAGMATLVVVSTVAALRLAIVPHAVQYPLVSLAPNAVRGEGDVGVVDGVEELRRAHGRVASTVQGDAAAIWGAGWKRGGGEFLLAGGWGHGVVMKIVEVLLAWVRYLGSVARFISAG